MEKYKICAWRQRRIFPDNDGALPWVPAHLAKLPLRYPFYPRKKLLLLLLLRTCNSTATQPMLRG